MTVAFLLGGATVVAIAAALALVWTAAHRVAADTARQSSTRTGTWDHVGERARAVRRDLLVSAEEARLQQDRRDRLGGS